MSPSRLRQVTRAFTAIGASALVMTGLAACDQPSEASTDTVTVMVFGSFSQPPFVLPQIETAAKAATDAINAEGGLNGRHIELISCDDQGNPNGATACGREAVDQGVVAVVGTFSLFSDGILPLLTEANIPMINSVAISELQLTSENSFPVLSSLAPNVAAFIGLRDNHGCAGTVSAAPENAGADYAETVLSGIAAEEEMTSTFVMYAPDETNFTSVAAQIASAGDCVMFGGGPADSAAIMTALSQSGTPTTNVGLSSIALPESTLTDLGTIGEGAMFYSPLYYPSTGEPEVLKAVENMRALDDQISIDESSLNAYAGLRTLQEAAALVEGDLTGQALSDVLNAPDTVIDTGMYPPTSWGAETSSILSEIEPRVRGLEYTEYSWQGGEWTATGTVSLTR